MRRRRSATPAVSLGTRSRCHLSTAVVAQSGKQTHHRTNFKPSRASIGQTQDVVVEAVLFVPHSVRADPVHRTGDQHELDRVVRRQFFVGRIVCGELEGDLEHVLTKQGDPSGPVRLFEMASGRQWRAAVEHADIVEPEKPALE